jgi:hypothetical protein
MNYIKNKTKTLATKQIERNRGKYKKNTKNTIRYERFLKACM